MRYTSTNSSPGEGFYSSFEEAILQGFASDGGYFVPETIPKVSEETLAKWKSLSFTSLALEIVSLFVDSREMSREELREVIDESYRHFPQAEEDGDDVVPLKLRKIPLEALFDDEADLQRMRQAEGREGAGKRSIFLVELFHGPTLAFKDLAMGFLCNVMDFFLRRRGGGERRHVMVATTGDTGPAAAFACEGKQALDCWCLYPKGLISEQQERQMTTLVGGNVHAVGVSACPLGGDSLDETVADLFGDSQFASEVPLGSVNSVNWGRVLVQVVHYFFSFFRAAELRESGGGKAAGALFAVPTGGFGNALAGSIAKKMGLDVHRILCANNTNNSVCRVVHRGTFFKAQILETLSSAIDIVVPYNFWRYLYLATGRNGEKISEWTKVFNSVSEKKEEATIRETKEKEEEDALEAAEQEHGAQKCKSPPQTGGFQQVHLGDACLSVVRSDFAAEAVEDSEVSDMILRVYKWTKENEEKPLLLDPHAAVAVCATIRLALGSGMHGEREGGPASGALVPLQTLVLGTAHPAKFPKVAEQSLGFMPPEARHPTIESARHRLHRSRQATWEGVRGENVAELLKAEMKAVHRYRMERGDRK
uniref:threonine synthase n=1 Tax=Chromera velia CCMP2878 TaxID=1169474 RepID=A0A0G4F5R3_9ALVE|mmetsp:Transcript_5840/g.11600  ORF Transcript_5840/g.11600 Transcript_5840/m.11600 type:complete len:594 (+) Transcript_5840:175-1956(+)|eukprot:Cvel_15265.t1-p1 / transcript=Cvel_15265.t1 / gene=Cvel_15265 / organism=Chromera_velia_CCMP2878 / gene_product=Threonine synthase, putative / transcript_product=Threonine synthase, putative / location=Cvel_scaffold1119:18542-25362(-) / protein_length=593 / sequence_SO=supercontig / SO=protein_coding / is_pseudo=false